jgi:hypothetical protein
VNGGSEDARALRSTRFQAFAKGHDNGASWQSRAATAIVEASYREMNYTADALRTAQKPVKSTLSHEGFGWNLDYFYDPHPLNLHIRTIHPLNWRIRTVPSIEFALFVLIQLNGYTLGLRKP